MLAKSNERSDENEIKSDREISLAAVEHEKVCLKRLYLDEMNIITIELIINRVTKIIVW